MNLTKDQREQLRMKYRGRCAYCGTKLDRSWQADHMEPVERISKFDPLTRKLVYTGRMRYPERDVIENLQPACRRCNSDKADSSVNNWRIRLEDSHARLERNYASYYHALRFGLIVPMPPKVVFFFERPRRRILTTLYQR